MARYPGSKAGLIIALAGRRIDAPDAEVSRFPLESVPRVREELTALLRLGEAHALVCSAACGADLLALQVAGQLGIERYVVLPFEPKAFRATSVTDRPGDWGPIFDHIIGAVGAAGHLEVGNGRPDDSDVYLAANDAIIRRARALASLGQNDTTRSLVAVVVWDGIARGDDDVTELFRRQAEDTGFRVVVISTSAPRHQ